MNVDLLSAQSFQNLPRCICMMTIFTYKRSESSMNSDTYSNCHYLRYFEKFCSLTILDIFVSIFESKIFKVKVFLNNNFSKSKFINPLCRYASIFIFKNENIRGDFGYFRMFWNVVTLWRCKRWQYYNSIIRWILYTW